MNQNYSIFVQLSTILSLKPLCLLHFDVGLYKRKKTNLPFFKLDLIAVV
jgi:hypothetical protein